MPKLLPDMRQRIFVPERMDAPDCPEGLLFRTMDQLRVINRLLSRSSHLLRRFLAPLPRDRDYHLLELGAGAADVAVDTLAWARQRGLQLRITALDLDPRIVRYAEAYAGGTPGLTIVQGDAFELADFGPVDLVFANHFLHHLSDADIVRLLALIHHHCRVGWLINDLRRSRASYVAFTVLAGLLMHRSFTWYDGRLSIRKGFVANELRELAEKAGLPEKQVKIATCLPGRIVLTGGA